MHTHRYGDSLTDMHFPQKRNIDNKYQEEVESAHKNFQVTVVGVSVS